MTAYVANFDIITPISIRFEKSSALCLSEVEQWACDNAYELVSDASEDLDLDQSEVRFVEAYPVETESPTSDYKSMTQLLLENQLAEAQRMIATQQAPATEPTSGYTRLTSPPISAPVPPAPQRPSTPGYTRLVR
jgi:hypothetical protein